MSESKKHIAVGEKVEVRLSEEDRNLILEHTYVDSDQRALLRVAAVDGDQIVVRLSLDELDDLLGHIAFAANHAKSKRLEKVMERVYDRLRVFEDMYVEVEP